MIGPLAALLAAALVAMPAPVSASPAPSSSQLIVVSARAYHATVATFTAYAIDGGQAHVAFGRGGLASAITDSRAPGQARR